MTASLNDAMSTLLSQNEMNISGCAPVLEQDKSQCQESQYNMDLYRQNISEVEICTDIYTEEFLHGPLNLKSNKIR